VARVKLPYLINHVSEKGRIPLKIRRSRKEGYIYFFEDAMLVNKWTPVLMEVSRTFEFLFETENLDSTGRVAQSPNRFRFVVLPESGAGLILFLLPSSGDTLGFDEPAQGLCAVDAEIGTGGFVSLRVLTTTGDGGLDVSDESHAVVDDNDDVDDNEDVDDSTLSLLEIVLASSNSTIPLVLPFLFPCKSTIVFVTLASSSLLMTVFE